MRNSSAGARSTGALLMCPVASSEPAAQISAKGRNKPVARFLPEEKLGTSLLRVCNTDTPLQGASTSDLPAVGRELKELVFGVGGFRLTNSPINGSLEPVAITGSDQGPGTSPCRS
jgi:hypothetical protein